MNKRKPVVWRRIGLTTFEPAYAIGVGQVRPPGAGLLLRVLSPSAVWPPPACPRTDRRARSARPSRSPASPTGNIAASDCRIPGEQELCAGHESSSKAAFRRSTGECSNTHRILATKLARFHLDRRRRRGCGGWVARANGLANIDAARRQTPSNLCIGDKRFSACNPPGARSSDSASDPTSILLTCAAFGIKAHRKVSHKVWVQNCFVSRELSPLAACKPHVVAVKRIGYDQLIAARHLCQ